MSIRYKLLIPFILGGALVVFVASWGAYSVALEHLRTQLVERGYLLATAINETTQAVRGDNVIRLAVQDITRQTRAVRGITIATRSPFTIWASSFNSEDGIEDYDTPMLSALIAATNSGLFGHFFADNGDLIVIQPLWSYHSVSAKDRADNTLFTSRDNKPSVLPRLPKELPYLPNSVQLIAESRYNGVVYLRFDWARVDASARGVPAKVASLAIGGVLLMMVFAYVLMHRFVLRPIKALGDAIKAQAAGDTSVQAPELGSDEFGRMGQAFNAMLKTLVERDQRFRSVVAHLPLAVSLASEKAEPLLSNDLSDKWFGSGEPSETRARNALPQSLNRAQMNTLRDGKTIIREHCLSNADREMRHFSTTFFPVLDVTGRLTSIGAASTDVTERKRAEAAAHKLAYYDSLTGLANRRLLEQHLRELRNDKDNGAQQAALLYLDLDGFKGVNDQHGHSAGDQVLSEIAKRLVTRERSQDLLSRISGDEFVMLLRGLHKNDARKYITSLCTQLVTLLSQPVSITDAAVELSVSIGVALWPDDAEDADSLMKRADRAMYQVKQHGRADFVFFEKWMQDQADRYGLLASRMRLGLENQEFALHYQPQVDLCSGRVLGVEALARWSPPDFGVVNPEEFISVAEQTGLIERLGEWVLDTACRQYMKWLNNGLSLSFISVNVSPRQFHSNNFCRMVASTLARHHMQPGALELEVTESVVIEDPEKTIATLNTLAATGITLAMDDFGTGYSSLSYLKRLPVTVVKIDRAFIMALPDNLDDARIVTAIVAMTQGMGHHVVAEGIEHEEHVQFLQKLGVGRGQGYHFAKPMPGSKLQDWAATRGDSVDTFTEAETLAS